MDKQKLSSDDSYVTENRYVMIPVLSIKFKEVTKKYIRLAYPISGLSSSHFLLFSIFTDGNERETETYR